MRFPEHVPCSMKRSRSQIAKSFSYTPALTPPQEPHMTRIMTRTFFPVGNGIFCLERFENRHAVVYDCGSASKRVIKRRVDELADRNGIDGIDVIDYVFVSHFHEDHVNGLPALLEKFDVRRVIMPLMSEEDRYLLWLGRQLRKPQPNVIPDFDSGDFVDKLILDPVGTVRRYNEGTEASFVEPPVERASRNIAPTENAGERPFRVSGMPKTQEAQQNRVIKGEITLKAGGPGKCWRYAPFTIRYAEKSDKLKQGLAELGIESDTDIVNYVERRGHKDIKDVYKKVTGGQLNLYSMAVYSHSPRTDLRQRAEPCAAGTSWYRERIANRELKAPCLYLGDYEAKEDENWNSLDGHLRAKANWSSLDGLGCLQVPHHGSHRNFTGTNSSRRASCPSSPRALAVTTRRTRCS